MAPEIHKYRKILKEIADELTYSDVGSLKFVCRDKIGGAALDRIQNDKPLELMKTLEEKALISPEDLSWLKAILKQIQRVDLVRKIPGEFCRSSEDAVDGGEMVDKAVVSSEGSGADAVSPYRMLLKDLADELLRDEVDTIKFLLNIPGGKAQKLIDGQSLFVYLEGVGKLSANNVTYLKRLLDEIQRKDLVRRIEEFSINKVQPQVVLVPITRDPASCYPMRRPHGIALIINISTHKGQTDDGITLDERKGSEVDVQNLFDLWKKLGFDVLHYHNLKTHDICTVVSDISGKMERDASCFVCCIMTHGKLGRIYGHDSKHLQISYITDLFKQGNCPALAGKPKLFFIQACRGDQRLTLGRSSHRPTSETGAARTTTTPSSDAVPVTAKTQRSDANAVPEGGQDDDDNESSFRRDADPNEADFLLGYSTAPGYVSFRSTDHGSWYVNALVNVFSTYYGNEDVMSMMTKVNQKVTDAYTSRGYKQCPAPVFTLTKKVYF